MKKLSDSSPTSLATRTLDAVDRAHARAATRLHEARNDLLAAVGRGLDRVEQLNASLIARARTGVTRIDHVSADAVNRAQGVVGQAIEKARAARAPLHLVS